MTGLTPTRPRTGVRWRRTALALAWATIAWNSIEAVVAIASDAAGRSPLTGSG